MMNILFFRTIPFLALLFLFHVNSHSQDIDRVIRTNGDTIYCIIQEVNEKHIGGFLFHNNMWIESRIPLTEVLSWSYNALSRKTFLKQGGKSPIPYSLDLIIMSDSNLVPCKILNITGNTVIFEMLSPNTNTWIETHAGLDKIKALKYNTPLAIKPYEQPGFTLFIELVGKGDFSINADFRISDNGRISVGTTFIDFMRNQDPPPGNELQLYLAISPMIYLEAGKRSSKLELGTGISIPVIKMGPAMEQSYMSTHKYTLLVFHGVLGYRYHKKEGLLFRAGFTPFYQPPNEFWPFFGLSLGYSF